MHKSTLLVRMMPQFSTFKRALLLLASITLLLPERSTWAQSTAVPTVAGTPAAPVTSSPIPPPDRDGDGVPDVADNCPDTWNPAQSDADANNIGDMCDSSFTSTPFVLQRMNFRAAGIFGDGHGTIVLSGIIDATDWGSAAALLTVLSGGFVAHVDGAGLVAPGETITFTRCGGSCVGSGPAVATFRPKVGGGASLLSVRLTARGRTFAPPLTTDQVAVTLSIGLRDRRGQIEACKVGRSSRTANCRVPLR